MDADVVTRAIETTVAMARSAHLDVDDALIVQNSNKLSLRLLPCDAFARVVAPGRCPAAHEVAALQAEIEVARRLSAAASPVASLDPRVEPSVHERDGFAVSFWTHYETVAPGPGWSSGYADALRHLHTGMRTVDHPVPSFVERVEQAAHLVRNRQASPALALPDRRLLLGALSGALEQIHRRIGFEQLLHGEPHAGNVLSTRRGPVFIDLETCCRGPVELDVAHVPIDVAAHYSDLDQVLLGECRRLVLAMVAAWRSDVEDRFPEGRKHGQDILARLRQGPPWPTLAVLSAG